jgi:hypothetical protein
MSSSSHHAQVEAHLALLNLEGEYARTWDMADAAGWAGLFTEDGIFEMEAAGSLRAATISGRAELTEFCRSFNARFRGLHLIHVPSLHIGDGAASGWIHFEFQSIPSSARSEVSRVAGVYQVDYVETERGWRIRKRLEKAVTRDMQGWYGLPELD